MTPAPEPIDARIALDRSPAEYAPGDRLEATVAIDGPQQEGLRAVELSVVWHTAGKGDEDLHVHEFVRQSPLAVQDGDAAAPLAINATLPPSPLSYAGVVVKVCWCVRVRLIYGVDRQTISEAPFQLGRVAAPALEETA